MLGNFNEAAFQFIYSFSHRSFLLDDLSVFLANYLPYLLVIGAIVFVFFFEDWKHRVFLFIEGALAALLSRGIITEFIRFFYHSPRPFVALNFTPLIPESGWSFPSGHAMLLFALATVIFYASRRLGWWYFALASLVCIARIFVGVHWPLDIVGGAVLGILSGVFVHDLLKSTERRMEIRKAR